jgi:hypothetical protein
MQTRLFSVCTIKRPEHVELSTWQDIYNTLVLSTTGISDHNEQQAISVRMS